VNNTPPPYDKPGAHGEPVPHGAGHGILALSNHLLRTYSGSKSLGIYNNRSVRNGHSTSLHAVARAIDWAYPTTAVRDEVWDAITQGGVGHALGIQACHDYNTRLRGGSKWGKHSAPARTWGHGQGVHYAHVGPGDKWLHIELDRDAAVNGNLMAGVGLTGRHRHPTTHVVEGHIEHAAHEHVHGPLVPHATIRNGDPRSDNAANLQHQLRTFHLADHRVSDPGNADGLFGPQSSMSLGTWQNAYGAHADGVYGPATQRRWREIADYLS
jgi:peptidoglycan hydrolase-like protein with peptidoglycan-binding domain